MFLTACHSVMLLTSSIVSWECTYNTVLYNTDFQEWKVKAEETAENMDLIHMTVSSLSTTCHKQNVPHVTCSCSCLYSKRRACRTYVKWLFCFAACVLKPQNKLNHFNIATIKRSVIGQITEYVVFVYLYCLSKVWSSLFIGCKFLFFSV